MSKSTRSLVRCLTAFIVLLGVLRGPLSGDGPVLAGQGTASTRLVLLYDNSRSQHLNLYASPDTRPLHVQGVRKRQDAVIQAVLGHLDADGGVRVGSFGDQIVFSPTWVRTPADFRRAFESVIQTGGPSPIWDAVYKAVQVLEAVPHRRVILLISDGKASGNIHGFEDALARAMRSGVIVHAVALSAQLSRQLNKERPGDPTERLRRLATATGGRYKESEPQDLAAACASVLDPG